MQLNGQQTQSVPIDFIVIWPLAAPKALIGSLIFVVIIQLNRMLVIKDEKYNSFGK
jgi:hypothetical protein